MSNEQRKFLLKYKLNKIIIIVIQVLIVLSFFLTWEILSRKSIINSFIFSSPTKVLNTIYDLFVNNNLLRHIWVSVYETLIAFGIGLLLSVSISIILYMFNNLYKVLDPFLTCLNSLPKVALGPMIIIIAGANIKSIIVMAVLINVIVSTIVITNGFYNTDKIKLKLMKAFKASKFQILKYLVIPSNYKTIISSFKLSISMSMIGLLPPVGENFIV